MQLLRILGVVVALALCPLGPLGFAQQQNVVTAESSSGVSATIEACERATWEAFKAGDEAKYRSLCCHQFFEISASGELHSLDDIANGMRSIVTKRYAMHDVVVTQPAENVCLIRYRLTVDYIEDGKELPTKKCFVAAVWIRREGKWLAASYQESRLEE